MHLRQRGAVRLLVSVLLPRPGGSQTEHVGSVVDIAVSLVLELSRRVTVLYLRPLLGREIRIHRAPPPLRVGSMTAHQRRAPLSARFQSGPALSPVLPWAVSASTTEDCW